MRLFGNLGRQISRGVGGLMGPQMSGLSQALRGRGFGGMVNAMNPMTSIAGVAGPEGLGNVKRYTEQQPQAYGPDLGLSKQGGPRPGSLMEGAPRMGLGQGSMTNMYMNALDGQDPMAQAVGQRRRRVQSKGMF